MYSNAQTCVQTSSRDCGAGQLPNHAVSGHASRQIVHESAQAQMLVPMCTQLYKRITYAPTQRSYYTCHLPAPELCSYISSLSARSVFQSSKTNNCTAVPAPPAVAVAQHTAQLLQSQRCRASPVIARARQARPGTPSRRRRRCGRCRACARARAPGAW